MTAFQTSRKISATPGQIFAAFAPERIVRWWGPDGFTQTSRICEFWVGGRWSFTLHGPDGKDYANECVFAEIVEPTKVVIQHVSEPKFRLTVTLEPTPEGAVVFWNQVFEDPEVARGIEHICVPANDQNLARLEAEVFGR